MNKLSKILLTLTILSLPLPVIFLNVYTIHYSTLGDRDDENIAAIKEIVETVIDKCAEKAETYEYPFLDACGECGHTATYIEPQSILNVKTMIDYEQI